MFRRGVDNEFCSGARGTCLTCECVCETNLTAVIDNERLQRPGVRVRYEVIRILYNVEPLNNRHIGMDHFVH